MSDDPTPDPKPDPTPEPMTADSITENIFKHLSEDEKLTDDDRRAISEGLATKTGGKIPEPIKPKSGHWSDRKLW
jgi:hypothetical protein